MTHSYATERRDKEGMISSTEKGLYKTNQISIATLNQLKAHALAELKKGNISPAVRFNKYAKSYNEFGPVVRDWNIASNVTDMLGPGGQGAVARAANPARAGSSVGKQHAYAKAAEASNPLYALALSLHEIGKTEKNPEGQKWDPLTYVEKALNKGTEALASTKPMQAVEKGAAAGYGATVAPVMNFGIPGTENMPWFEPRREGSRIKPLQTANTMFSNLLDAPATLAGGLRDAVKNRKMHREARRERGQAITDFLSGESEDLEGLSPVFPRTRQQELQRHMEFLPRREINRLLGLAQEKTRLKSLDEKAGDGRYWFQHSFQLRDDELDNLTEMARAAEKDPNALHSYRMSAFDLGLDSKYSDIYKQLVTTGEMPYQETVGLPFFRGDLEKHRPEEWAARQEEKNKEVTYDIPTPTHEEMGRTSEGGTTNLFQINPFPGIPQSVWDPSDSLAAFGEEMQEDEYYQRLEGSGGMDATPTPRPTPQELFGNDLGHDFLFDFSPVK